jgi:hypothetical protein
MDALLHGSPERYGRTSVRLATASLIVAGVALAVAIAAAFLA